MHHISASDLGIPHLVLDLAQPFQFSRETSVMMFYIFVY